MKIFRLCQAANCGYDVFDSCIVCAEDEEDAKSFHPGGGEFLEGDKYYDCSWVRKRKDIICEEIGKANKNQRRGVICASFNAG